MFDSPGDDIARSRRERNPIGVASISTSATVSAAPDGARACKKPWFEDGRGGAIADCAVAPFDDYTIAGLHDVLGA